MYDITFFSEELAMITDPILRDLTKEVLRKSPKYFWSVPSSLTGKYHPINDTTPGGNCRHTKTVFYMASNIARYKADANGKELLDLDVVRCAALCHDITKYGIEEVKSENREYFKIHGETAAMLCRSIGCEYFKGIIGDMVATGGDYVGISKRWWHVCDCVMTHNGRWGSSLPQTCEAWTIHFADMAAATRIPDMEVKNG